jgi:hypothetical protein
MRKMDEFYLIQNYFKQNNKYYNSKNLTSIELENQARDP